MKPDLTYAGVRVHSAKTVVVSSVSDDLAEDTVDHAIVWTWSAGKWTKKPYPQAVVALCSTSIPTTELFNVCATGEVYVASRAGFTKELVDPSDGGPSHLLTLRAACLAEGILHVTGMARRVYRRTAPNNWEAIDEGVYVPRADRNQSAGFLCIEGTSKTNLVAAGYKGEIWHFDGNEWTQQESPTNVALSVCKQDENGTFYLSGLAGTLLRGRALRWEQLSAGNTQDDFWGATFFQGRMYFATKRGLFRLNGDVLEPVGFGVSRPITTGYLDGDDEVMWSVGSKDLFSTRDGESWESVAGPS